MTNINFGASLINRPNIKKLSNGNYINTKANFVELSCSKNIQENVDDKKAITELRAKWLTPFSSNINKEINQPQIPSKVHFYALTTQRKNLKKLDPDEILAIAKYIQEPKERDYLSLLQVNPQYTSTNSISQSKYRHCGKAMLDSFKVISKNKGIDVLSTAQSRDFYYKNGFMTNTFFDSFTLHWDK